MTKRYTSLVDRALDVAVRDMDRLSVLAYRAWELSSLFDRTGSNAQPYAERVGALLDAAYDAVEAETFATR